MIEILDGAIFVADSHYPHHGDEFLLLLERISSGKMTTPQLFLMGDIFDLLFGYNEYIKEFSRDAILLLQRVSKDIEVYYFEGNHDFLLRDIFESITIYPRDQQPQIFSLGDKKVALSHGDRYSLGWGYHIYSLVVRSRILITILNPFSKYIIDDRMVKLAKKSICNKFYDFDNRAREILTNYNSVDLVIEGHYHQAKIVDSRYISLPSLACQRQIVTISSNELQFVDID